MAPLLWRFNEVFFPDAAACQIRHTHKYQSNATKRPFRRASLPAARAAQTAGAA